AAAEAIGSGAIAPDEARRKYFGLGPVAGGHTPYMQQQMFSLEALAHRDAADPFAKPTPPAGPGRGAGDRSDSAGAAGGLRPLVARESAGRMTADDLAALVEGIAPVVRDVSARACADLLDRKSTRL